MLVVESAGCNLPVVKIFAVDLVFNFAVSFFSVSFFLSAQFLDA